MNTKVLEHEHDTRHHPSFVNALPNIIAEPVDVGYCEVCAWLAGRIRAGRHVEDYAALAIDHVATQHPSYGIHNIGDGDVRETRQTYNGGAS